MAINPRRKSDAARRANQVIRSRTVLVMVLLGVCTFVALFWKLYDLQIRQHEDLQEQAVSQQTRSTDHYRLPRHNLRPESHAVGAVRHSGDGVHLSQGN